MKRLCLIGTITVLLVTGNVLAGTYGGGSGTSGDPYQIRTPEQMNAIGVNSDDWGSHFVLMNDIDMSAYTGTQFNIIGTTSVSFTGSFDGNEHVIRNLTYTTGAALNHVGLFGFTWGAVIQNLGVENVHVSSGGNQVGGLVGSNRGTITACYTTGSVSGVDRTGGLAGENWSGTITSCYTTASVSGGNSCGGLVGANYNSVTNCYATGSVNGAFFIGGLVGWHSGTMTHCYAVGGVSGSWYVGGVAGQNYEGTFTGCFWNNQTSGPSVGVGEGSSSGVTGKSTVQMQTLSTFTAAGWDFSGSDGDPADWRMIRYPHLIWEPLYGSGTGTQEDPYQIWAPEHMNSIGLAPDDWGSHFILMDDLDMSGYTGTQYNIVGSSSTPFSGTFDGNGHVILNLTYSTGSGIDFVGLFGYTSGAVIQNLGLENLILSTGGSYVGGIAGWNSGTLTGCYVNGSIHGYQRIGGLAGGNGGIIAAGHAAGSVSGGGNDVGGVAGWNAGSLTECYAVSSVSTIYYSVGGLAGWNSGTLTDCYATGSASGTASVAGLVGYSDHGTLTDCYATGSISATGGNVGGLVGGDNSSSINDCFWDMQTSGMATSAGGEGKTTVEMQTLSTFTEVGWDFADVWGIGNHQTYPYLKTHTEINPADNNYSGTVDMEDLAILAENWLID